MIVDDEFFDGRQRFETLCCCVGVLLDFVGVNLSETCSSFSLGGFGCSTARLVL